jgi:hypothetical protein
MLKRVKRNSSLDAKSPLGDLGVNKKGQDAEPAAARRRKPNYYGNIFAKRI